MIPSGVCGPNEGTDMAVTGSNSDNKLQNPARVLGVLASLVAVLVIMVLAATGSLEPYIDAVAGMFLGR